MSLLAMFKYQQRENPPTVVQDVLLTFVSLLLPQQGVYKQCQYDTAPKTHVPP